MRKLLLIIPLLLLSKLQAQELGPIVFKKVSKSVVTVKSSLDIRSPKASYGSGFFVSKDGLVVTNYHVISRVIDPKFNYKVYVVHGKRTYEARVLKIDIISDLALLKIARKRGEYLELETSTPPSGSRVFSVGTPKDLKLSIVDGTYNGVVKNGLYRNIYVSTPINSGMSGGPSVDISGRVLGVNVSHMIGAENISFIVPSTSVTKLVSSAKLDQEVSKEKSSSIIHKQLSEIQRELVKDATSSNESFRLKEWNLAKSPDGLRCWISDHSEKKRREYELLTHSCFVRHSTYIQRDFHTGTYEIKYSYINPKNMKYMRSRSLIRNHFDADAKFSNVVSSSISKTGGVVSRFECDESIIVNKHDISLKVVYCTRGYKKFPKLYDVAFKALTLNSHRPLKVSARLKGFERDNTKKFISHVLSNIERGSK